LYEYIEKFTPEKPERMKNIFRFIIVLFLAGFINVQAYSHCEVPCGIYQDHLRIELIKEHILTIEKAMNQIEALSAEEEINYNQLVRWIDTKEHHANLIQEIAEQYFMTQRIKPVDPEEAEAYGEYITQLSLAHEMLIYSMKAKQSTDLAFTEKLQLTVEKFEDAYFGPEAHDHDHDH
jgi:nickel superoxide dismutase